MRKSSPKSLRRGNVQQQKSIAVKNAILRTSVQLAECSCDEIEKITHVAISEISRIESAEKAGWFFLGRSGELVDVYPCADSSSSLTSLFNGGLDKLPWCLAQLNAGKSIVLCDIKELPPFAEADRQFLSDLGIGSIALLRSNSSAPNKNVLILLSISNHTNWSAEIVDQCALLENIFSNAYRRKLAQCDAEASEHSFQQLFKTSTIGMALLDEQARFITANAAFCDTFGYSQEDLPTMHFDELAEPTHRGKIATLLSRLRYSPARSYRAERTFVRKNRSLMSARIRVSLLKRSALEDPLPLVMIEDITEKKHAEHELHRQQEEVRTLASQLIQSQEDERRRLARELHDDIGQRLSLVTSEVALLASQHFDAPFPTDRLRRLRDDLDSLCSDIHGISHSLHSYKLQHLGLKSALKDLCMRLSRPNFRIDLNVEELEEPKSKEVSLCLYRVVQEALNNSLKHSHTAVVAVTLTKVENTLYMTIQDSGVGFETNASPQGLGLISMEERLKLVDGQFKFHSIVGRGTEIWVSISDAYDAVKPTANHQSDLHLRSSNRTRDVA